MTSTLIIPEELHDLSETELRSKFLQCTNDVARLEQSARTELPLARASMETISRELVLRRLRKPKLPGLG